ncbi:MAG: GNAT family N-acetyltransferase [Nitrospirota bacterium]
MIRELIWDSKLFGKKIGVLSVDVESINQIPASLKTAKGNGYRYVVCKLYSQNTTLIRALESNGFYLTDIGVIWEVEIKHISLGKNRDYNTRKLIKIASESDIPVLKRMITSLFGESRFYNDPFYSRGEADKLYQTWIENSVRGEAADAVFIIPGTGFVTCKKSAKGRGEIKLIGIKRSQRGKRLGTNLLAAAVDWFRKQNVQFVRARTQLKNLPAMNFYSKSGFRVAEYDLIFSKIL